MKYKLSIIFILTSIFIISGCMNENVLQSSNCDSLKEEFNNFDNYVRLSRLPIFENEDSLCHGFSMSYDFNSLEPKYAIAELDNFDNHSLTFKGINESAIFYRSEDDSNKYQKGKYYKVNMNNICRTFFMMADSRYPSPLTENWESPVEVNCKK